MSQVVFRVDGAVLRGRVISEYHENVKVYVEGELFERLIPRAWVIEWVKPGVHPPAKSGKRARSRRPMTGGPKTDLRHGA